MLLCPPLPRLSSLQSWITSVALCLGEQSKNLSLERKSSPVGLDGIFVAGTGGSRITALDPAFILPKSQEEVSVIFSRSDCFVRGLR